MGKIRPRSSGDLPLPFRELKKSANTVMEAAQRGILPLAPATRGKKHRVEMLSSPNEEAKDTKKYALKKFKRLKAA